jgi:hypothetical protein
VLLAVLVVFLLWESVIIDPCIVSGESHSDNGVNWLKILVGEVLCVFLGGLDFFVCTFDQGSSSVS